MADFKVWYENDRTHAEYLIATTDLKKYAPSIERIRRGKRFPENPDTLQQVVYLDMPDVIVTVGFPEKVVFGVEFCAEAPSGHDVFQRIARVAAAAEFGAPFAFIFPEKKWVIRRKSQRWDLYNPLSLRAIINIARFHAVPISAFFWEASQKKGDAANGHLLCDSKYPGLPWRKAPETGEFAKFMNLVLEQVVQKRDFRELVFDPLYMAREAWMWQRFSQRADGVSKKQRWSPLTSCRQLATSELIKTLKTNFPQQDITPPDYVLGRSETVVYEPGTKTFRSDPYAGSLVGIDYLACRNGPTIRHRYKNLAISFGQVSFNEMRKLFRRYYAEQCPFSLENVLPDRFLALHLKDGCRYTKQKELRIYCYAADFVIFSDAVLY